MFDVLRVALKRGFRESMPKFSHNLLAYNLFEDCDDPNAQAELCLCLSAKKILHISMT